MQLFTPLKSVDFFYFFAYSHCDIAEQDYGFEPPFQWIISCRYFADAQKDKHARTNSRI